MSALDIIYYILFTLMFDIGKDPILFYVTVDISTVIYAMGRLHSIVNKGLMRNNELAKCREESFSQGYVLVLSYADSSELDMTGLGIDVITEYITSSLRWCLV